MNTLTLEKIESFNLEKSSYQPDHDDKGYLFTLPKSGIELSCLFMCNGESNECDSLEGLDRWIYIDSVEELELLISMTYEQTLDWVSTQHSDFEKDEYLEQ